MVPKHSHMHTYFHWCYIECSQIVGCLNIVCFIQTTAFSQSIMLLQEQDLSPEKRVVANVGKMDAKKHLEAEVQKMMSGNIVQCMGTMLDTIVF